MSDRERERVVGTRQRIPNNSFDRVRFDLGRPLDERSAGPRHFWLLLYQKHYQLSIKIILRLWTCQLPTLECLKEEKAMREWNLYIFQFWCYSTLDGTHYHSCSAPKHRVRWQLRVQVHRRRFRTTCSSSQLRLIDSLYYAIRARTL